MNETIYDELLLTIDDNYIDENKIVLTKNKKIHVPLTWIISSKQIFLQKNKKSEKILIYDDISEAIFSEKMTQSQLDEKGKEIEKIKSILETKLNNYQKMNLHHPKYKDYISTFVLQKFNNKNSKILSVKDENKKNITFYLDYCSLINN
jgi:peptidyl-tRNA hydrolase